MENIALYIEQLVQYALEKKLIDRDDVLQQAYARNRLLSLLNVAAPYEGEVPHTDAALPELLAPILTYAIGQGLCGETLTEQDLFDTKLMGELTPQPAMVNLLFKRLMTSKSARAATDWFYALCIACGYIRMERIEKNIKWPYQSPFGELEITINLSKPEKDPKEIAKLKDAPAAGYPKCMLCFENTGYEGRLNFPARQNHRMVPITLQQEPWFFQYSPYVYYNEHCIVLNKKHIPMKIDKSSFERLCDFVDQFPHYFIGSNADLPIVGGSILNHDHFQGGSHTMPMAKADILWKLKASDFAGEISVLNWPMTALRLGSTDRTALCAQADKILRCWREYSDPTVEIHAYTGDTPHNTITPILRKKGELYEMDLVLRNNRTTEQHPLGIFHPHEELHHIKKENIGLIEVMGLFILPARLKAELAAVIPYLCGKEDVSAIRDSAHMLYKHLAWIQILVSRYGTKNSPDEAQKIINEEVGAVCAQVLRDAGVYKQDEKGFSALRRFLSVLQYEVKE